MAAAERAGLTPAAVIARIVAAALERHDSLALPLRPAAQLHPVPAIKAAKPRLRAVG